MFKKGSLRIRYLISYVLMLLTVVIFLAMLYAIYMNNNQRYINSATLERFTYASESISALIDRMDLAAANAENSAAVDAAGPEAVLDSRVASTLKNIEDSLGHEPPRACFLRQGDRFIHTSGGRMLYADFENACGDRYDLTMSQAYFRLLSNREKLFLPILNSEGSPGAFAYAVPFTFGGSLPGGQMVFILDESIIAEEFTAYMGDLTGDLYMYTSRYELLFRSTEQAEELLPFPLLIRQRGVGVQPYGSDKVLLSVSNAQKGLNFALVCRNAAFYQDMYRSGRFILGLIIALTALLSALFWWFTRASYKPIQRLTREITGQDYTDISSNELNLIRSTYNRTVEEAEQLNSRLTELTPLVTEHLVQRMVHGQIQDRQVFDDLIRYARVKLSGSCYAAMCLVPFGESEDPGPEDIRQKLDRLTLPGVTLMQGEMSDENALCLIANYDSAPEDMDSAARETAEKLLNALSGEASVRIGVGGAYPDPLRMADSYGEARAAVQLAPADKKTGVFPYAAGAIDTAGADSLKQLPPMLCSLMVNAVRRGEAPVAQRALRELLSSVGSTTESMLYYRFYAVNLSSLLLRAAEEEGIQPTAAQTQPLIGFSSRQEFEQNITDFTDALCRQIGERRTRQDQEAKEKLMSYILNHYMEYDLSVQSAAEAVDIRRDRVSAIVREDTGLNFVQYVSYLRMNEFKRLLVESDQPITECVTAIGYQDAPNFLRKFKVVEGVTAGQYRAEHRKT